MVWFLCFILIFNDLCFAKITDKQYASIPELFHQDNYDKCMLLGDEALYCSFTYELEPLNAKNVSETWKIIEEVSSDDFNYRHDHLRHGICVPFTCPSNGRSNQTDVILRQRITNCYNNKFKSFGLKGTITSIQCETNEPRYPMDCLDIIVGAAFICYMAWVVFASFYEGFARLKPDADYQKITSAPFGRIAAEFSVARNWQKFKTIKNTPDIDKLRAFQGARFYNMILVILSHTVMCFIMVPVSNTKYTEGLTQKSANIFLSSGSLAVSTNFLMSSFFLYYGILSYLEGNKEISPKFLLTTFIARYIRLTPTLVVTVLFHSTWLRHLGSGPNWYNIMGKEYLRCRKNWWTNLLYLNNVIDSGNMCLAHTWYLALDTQYFITLLFIIWFVTKYPKLIWPTLGCLLGINVLATFVRNYKENYELILIPKPEVVYDMKNVLNNTQFHNQSTDIIGCTAGPIIGLGYGYLFYRYKNRNLFTSNLLFHQILYYFLTYGLALGIIIIPGLLLMINNFHHDAFWASLYTAFSRPIFCFAIGYGLFAATQGLGCKDYASLPILFHLDNYDNCMLLEDEAFYCSFTYELYPSQSNNTNSALWKTLTELKSNLYSYRHDILRHGICVPNSCPEVTKTHEVNPRLRQELAACYNEKFSHMGIGGNVTNVRCETIDPKYPVDQLDTVVGFLFISYLLFVIFASVCEQMAANQESEVDGNFTKSSWRRVLAVFSVPRNWCRLKTINSSPDIERLRSIQGVRFYNMILVILTHTVMTLFLTAPVSNTKLTENITEKISAAFLTSGPLCVSTFFMISSWLMIHGIFVTFSDKKEISLKIIVRVFINRYIRLTPSLAIIIALQTTWLRHLGTGPNWNHVVGQEFLRCRKNWWANLFYIHSYVDPENMCLQTTWYLARDFQYLGIILLIIWLIKKHQKYVWIILGSLLSLSMAIAFYENYVNDFPALMVPKPESLYDTNHTLKNKQWHIQYIGFFGNIGGSLIGLSFGYIYFKYKETKLFTKKIHTVVWWFVSHVPTYATVLIPGFLTLSRNVPHNIFWASVHVAISRPAFAFGIGFALFGISQGVGGIVKWILEWQPLYVLGRLTYSAYLVHIPLLLLRAGMTRAPVYVNDYFIFLELVGNLGATYLLATVFTLLFEIPIFELQKLIMPQDKQDLVEKKKED